MNLWPPYLFAGISITRIAPDFREIDVCLRDRVVNRNIMGTHFGGSLFAMTDPFYVIMLRNALGPGYQVWDKRASIDFKVPGRGTVRASFVLTEEVLNNVRAQLAASSKTLVDFVVSVVDSKGATIATIEKSVYLRRPPPKLSKTKAAAVEQNPTI